LTAVLGWHMLHHFGNEAREMLSGTAAGLLSCGTIGDDYGRRRTFLAGTLVLVLVRVLQGIGLRGALCLPLARYRACVCRPAKSRIMPANTPARSGVPGPKWSACGQMASSAFGSAR
jgi:hypothetical protein